MSARDGTRTKAVTCTNADWTVLGEYVGTIIVQVKTVGRVAVHIGPEMPDANDDAGVVVTSLQPLQVVHLDQMNDIVFGKSLDDPINELIVVEGPGRLY